MNKVITFFAVAMISQSVFAQSIPEFRPLDTTIDASNTVKDGALLVFEENLAAVIYKNLDAGTYPGNEGATFKSGTAMLCWEQVAKGITSHGCIARSSDISMPIASKIKAGFVIVNGAALGTIGGQDAISLYESMITVPKAVNGIKAGNEFLCVKAETVEKSVCIFSIDMKEGSFGSAQHHFHHVSQGH